MSVVETRAGAAADARPTAYRSRVLREIERLLRPLPTAARALDFGAGDGWFARQVARCGLARHVVPVDVRRWPGADGSPVIFDGERLPFADRAFDLTYAIDVLHHCPDPEGMLDEVLRCTRMHFLIKDHTYRTVAGWSTLCVLDELGNRRFGVPSPYRYQRQWAWSRVLEDRGFALVERVHPAPCHTGILGSLTNGLQFLALWRRNGG
jgi:SAM-dependent methyltransferase